MKTIIVADLGINHNGSIKTTKELIDVAHSAGCDYVKFQKRDVENGGCYTKEELDSPRESPFGKTTRDQKFGIEFTVEQYREIDAYCKELGIGWFTSCWDLNSLDAMEKEFPHTPFIKIASALATNREFLKKATSYDKPVILSTGMLRQEQIEIAARLLGKNLHSILHCTSTYPTKPTEMNLMYVRTLFEKVSSGWLDDCRPLDSVLRVGFSNHYSGLAWVPAVIALGADVVEFHITLDRTMYGSDQAASIEPEGVKKLVSYVRLTEEMLGSGNKEVYESERPIIKKLRKKTDF